MDILEELIEIVKGDSQRALGCTEPVAVGYCANVCGSLIDDKDKIKNVEVIVSKNIYKNGKSVYIPVVQEKGLMLAASLGIFADKVEDGFMVFSKINKEIIDKAEKFIEEGKITLREDNTPNDVYVETIIETDKDKGTVIICGGHTKLQKVIKNGKVLYEQSNEKDEKENSFNLKDLSFQKLREIVENAPEGTFDFTLEGIEINKKAAIAGLDKENSLGSTLKRLRDENILPKNFITEARIMTAAAADMRMSGQNYEIMTSGGSGNQGIGVILPIEIVASYEDISKDKLAKALFFGHILNRYVKEYSGKLSGMCGCAIGAAVGATCSIAWLLGGTDEMIAGAATNVYANLTGMVCDGAKESCSMKLSTSAEEAIISAYLAVNGMISDKSTGVVGKTIEETISNIGKLSRTAFKNVDDVMLEIIKAN